MGIFSRHAALVFLALTLIVPVASATEDDIGGWAALITNGRFSDDSGGFRYHFDTQARYFDIGSGVNQWLARAGVGADLGGDVSAWAGYARFRVSNRAGIVVDENRFWQDLVFAPAFATGHRLSARLRFEQRSISEGDDTRLVGRLAARYTIPVGESTRFFFGGETFHDLNSSDWGGGTGESQNRLFLGIGWTLGKRTSLEARYMQQLFKLDGSEDLLNHLGVLTLRF